jgi:hypothetical protein
MERHQSASRRSGQPARIRAEVSIPIRTGKSQYEAQIVYPIIPPPVWALNSNLSSCSLEEMTGILLIQTLTMPALAFLKRLRGGHLDIHADFNLHGRMQV